MKYCNMVVSESEDEKVDGREIFDTTNDWKRLEKRVRFKLFFTCDEPRERFEKKSHKFVKRSIPGIFMFKVEMLTDSNQIIVHFAESLFPFRAEIIYEFFIRLQIVFRSDKGRDIGFSIGIKTMIAKRHGGFFEIKGVF